MLTRIEYRPFRRWCASLRINPDVDPKTHPYISTGLKANKFGIAHEDAIAAYKRAHELPGLNPVGIDCHIGSQLTDISPLIESLDKLLNVIDELTDLNIVLKHVDLGGGLGVTYDQEKPPHPSEYLSIVKERLKDRALNLVLEPGRSIAANAGIFVTRTILTKTQNTSIDLVHDIVFEMQLAAIEKIDGDEQAADIFTKAVEVCMWPAALLHGMFCSHLYALSLNWLWPVLVLGANLFKS